MNVKNTISCHCGACSLKLNEPSPKFSLMCACEDCRQALSWAAQRGGKKPKDIIYSAYFRSDIQSYDGIKNMTVTQLRSDARSTRVYCKNCFSCIAIDHVVYEDNVFMMQPEHCVQDFNAITPPKAIIHLIDYNGEATDVPSETIPIFHSLQYPQERKRFRAIKPISESFAPSKTSLQGITLRDLIAKINKVEVLHLEKGNVPV